MKVSRSAGAPLVDRTGPVVIPRLLEDNGLHKIISVSSNVTTRVEQK